MKPLLVTILSLHLFAISARADVISPASKAPLTEFVRDGVLSSSEIMSVVLLAERSGISKVHKVQTFHYIPVLTRGIWVFGAEEERGRMVSFKMLEVERDGWSTLSRPNMCKSLDLFWIADDSRLATRVFVKCSTQGGGFRVEIEQGIDVALVDKVVEAFASGSVVLPDRPDGEPGKPRNTQPTSIRRAAENGHYTVYFEPTSTEYEVELKDDRVLIISFGHIDV